MMGLPELFNTYAVGAAALMTALAAIATVILNARSNKKNRDQVAAIAKDQAAVAQQTHEIKVSIDGRMDELLAMTRELAKAKAEAIATAAATVLRDENVVSQVAGAVVERIGAAADRAAATVPAKPPT